jgi:hypothetical protein
MSRRNQIGMTSDEINGYLRSAKTMTLVSNGKDGFPHPMPMWFALDDDNTIYMTTFRKSQKVKNLQRDPKVTLMVESGVQYQQLKGLIIYAEVEFLDATDAASDIMFRVSVQRGEASADDENQAKSGMQRSAEKRIGMKFKPQRIVSWDHGKLGGVY